MSNLRAIVILAILTLSLLVANVVLRFGGVELDLVNRYSLVNPLTEVTALRLERRDALPVSLVKSDRWRIVHPYQSEANEQVVLKLLDSMSSVKIVDSVSEQELLKIGRTAADFSLDHPRVKVVLTTASGKSETISFGSTSPSGDAVYASVDGDTSVYQVPFETIDAVDVSLDCLRLRSLARFSVRDITAFDVRSGRDKSYSFSFDSDGWKSSAGVASADKINDFLGCIASAEAETFVWPLGVTNESEVATSSLLSSYGLDPESATVVSLKDAKGRQFQLSFGKEGDRGVYALAQDSSVIVTVPAALRDMVVSQPAQFTDYRLFRLESASIKAFTLTDGDVSCIFAMGANGKWNLEAPISAPANDSFVEDVLNRIVRLTSADITESGVRLSVGGDASPVVVGRACVLGDQSLLSARSLQMLSVPEDQVKRIVRIASQGDRVLQNSVVYDRVRKDWIIEDEASRETVDTKGVSAVLSAVKSLDAAKVVAIKVLASDLSGYGLDRPYLTLAIDRDIADAVRRNIIIGAKTKLGRYATIGSSDAIFELTDEVVNKLSSPIVKSN